VARTTKFTVTGLDELADAIKRVSTQVQGRALAFAVDGAAEVFLEGLETRAPRDRGQLESHIIKHVSTAKADHNAVDVGPDKGGFHGMFQELGTIDMPPNPWMRPTFDEDKDRALNVFKRKLSAGLI
jgi:HK97 gp10 family phage protein